MWLANIGRLIWKEYRVQRSVWLSLLAGTALLQGVVAYSVEPRSLGAGAFALAFVLSACYAAACAGILFAGEREEETDLCLRQLPLRQGPLVAAKLSFALLTIGAFVAASLLSGWGASVLANVSLQEVLKQDLSLLARAVVGVLVWGLLFSLLVRRVLVVVLCAAVMELVVTGIVGNFTEAYEHRAYFAIAGAVAGVDLWLSRRWAAGEVVLPIPGFGPLAERARRSPSTRWVRWLSRAVQRGSPLARTCGALVWREFRTAAAFCLWWIPLGVLFVDLLPRFTGIPANSLFLVATPVVCGLLVCLGDQRQQTHRFLCERGISAVTVWACKQAVWLLLGLALVSAFGAWDTLMPGRFRNAATEESFTGVGPFADVIRHTVHVPAMSLSAPFDSRADRALQWEFVCGLVLSLYAVGQLASLWIRRSVLAFGAALIGASVVGAWLGVLVKGDVPLAHGAWPVVIAWAGASLFLAGRWLRGDARWRTRLLQCGWVVVPALGVVAASASYRAHQVPLVDPGIQWPLLEYQRDQFDPAWSQEWREVLGELDRYAVRGTPDDTAGSLDTLELEGHLLKLGNALSQPHGGIDPLILRPYGGHSLVSIGSVIQEAARLHVERGELGEAWRAYVAGLRVTRFIVRQCASWDDWLQCLAARNVILNATRQWATHPGQTPELLRAAVAFVQAESGDSIGTREMLTNRYVQYRQLLEHRGRLWDESRDELSAWGVIRVVHPLQCANAPAFERERIRRLIDLCTFNDLAGRKVDPRSIVARWSASTPLLPPDFRYSEVSGTAQWDVALQNALANERGTAVVIALYAYKLQHGKFPDDLSELAADGLMVSLRDPCGDGRLGYRPQGFPKPVLVARNVILPAEQPLLWSAGAARATITQAVENVGLVEPHQVSAGEYFATNSMSVHFPAGAMDLQAMNSDPNRMVFVILGMQADPAFVLPPGAVLQLTPDTGDVAPAAESDLK